MKIPVMYLGERTDWRGEIRQLFRDRKGEDFFWAGRKHVYFGEIYEIEKKGGGKAQDHLMAKAPKRVEVEGWEPTEKERTEYEAAKVACTDARAQRRKAYEFKRPNEKMVRAVELMRPFYLACTDNDRRRLMGWFSNECSKKRRK